MAEHTLISWADATLNFWIGCTEVSNGPKGACANCYARTWGGRFGVEWGSGKPRRRTVGNLAKAMALERRAVKEGRPILCFSNSLSDIFDNEVPIEWLRDAFEIMRRTPHVIYLLLTKRPGNIVKRAQEAGGLPPNAAIGCTVVTQAEANRDIPVLLHAKAILQAILAFVSMEPLMERVRLIESAKDGVGGNALYSRANPRLDWVITGGESGAHARPSHPDWFRSLRDQCAAAGVAFHHKQNGEWAVVYDRDLDDPDWRDCPKDDQHPHSRYLNLAGGHGFHGERVLYIHKIGKKDAGRELDGRTWDERPEVRA